MQTIQSLPFVVALILELVVQSTAPLAPIPAQFPIRARQLPLRQVWLIQLAQLTQVNPRAKRA
ncbi:MAG: hypothetical protein EDM05_050820 [Leptolyngbya sp. IPPAS B-1204]|nr:hypothetical protein [Elainella sp. C42_A2020_010]RNJ69361.1 MAG: hypothetical protein EDM05_10970 [Leptolyngbya sp. IPPAS B-1204]